jgi:hypothetical protein
MLLPCILITRVSRTLLASSSSSSSFGLCLNPSLRMRGRNILPRIIPVKRLSRLLLLDLLPLAAFLLSLLFSLGSLLVLAVWYCLLASLAVWGLRRLGSGVFRAFGAFGVVVFVAFGVVFEAAFPPFFLTGVAFSSSPRKCKGPTELIVPPHL